MGKIVLITGDFVSVKVRLTVAVQANLDQWPPPRFTTPRLQVVAYNAGIEDEQAPGCDSGVTETFGTLAASDFRTLLKLRKEGVELVSDTEVGPTLLSCWRLLQSSPVVLTLRPPRRRTRQLQLM